MFMLTVVFRTSNSYCELHLPKTQSLRVEKFIGELSWSCGNCEVELATADYA